ncbi:hypothetical protein D3272_14715 [Lichenibacterium ramalinae]|uniref:Uncharacterized protein n=2 Tax=Lichenibacterium ramalinae TaxID=2316527 RepID=A0A4V1RIG8_9HYPH|nr:hypothetical protein D3272_14715 [Lichenibacterium ramalinae]
MILIFAAMTAALAAAALGLRRLGAAALLAGLVLSAGLFLFEIHSREDGFAMPWLSTRGEGTGGAAGRDAVA